MKFSSYILLSLVLVLLVHAARSQSLSHRGGRFVNEVSRRCNYLEMVGTITNAELKSNADINIIIIDSDGGTEESTIHDDERYVSYFGMVRSVEASFASSGAVLLWKSETDEWFDFVSWGREEPFEIKGLTSTVISELPLVDGGVLGLIGKGYKKESFEWFHCEEMCGDCTEYDNSNVMGRSAWNEHQYFYRSPIFIDSAIIIDESDEENYNVTVVGSQFPLDVDDDVALILDWNRNQVPYEPHCGDSATATISFTVGELKANSLSSGKWSHILKLAITQEKDKGCLILRSETNQGGWVYADVVCFETGGQRYLNGQLVHDGMASFGENMWTTPRLFGVWSELETNERVYVDPDSKQQFIWKVTNTDGQQGESLWDVEVKDVSDGGSTDYTLMYKLYDDNSEGGTDAIDFPMSGGETKVISFVTPKLDDQTGIVFVLTNREITPDLSTSNKLDCVEARHSKQGFNTFHDNYECFPAGDWPTIQDNWSFQMLVDDAGWGRKFIHSIVEPNPSQSPSQAPSQSPSHATDESTTTQGVGAPGGAFEVKSAAWLWCMVSVVSVLSL